MAENFDSLAANALADPVRRARIAAYREQIDRSFHAVPIQLSIARFCMTDISTGLSVHEPGRATSAATVALRLVPSRSVHVA